MEENNTHIVDDYKTLAPLSKKEKKRKKEKKKWDDKNPKRKKVGVEWRKLKHIINDYKM